MLIVLAIILASQASACGNGECDPPPPPPPPPVDVPENESWIDRHGTLPVSRPLPCCIAEGKLVPKPTLFMSAKRALLVCEKAKAKGDALIYECPGQVSPEAVK